VAEVARLDCEDCEGGGWVLQLHAPTGERHVIPCPEDRFTARCDEVEAAIIELPLERRFLARERWRALLNRLKLCDATQCPCPACSGRGWVLRIVQTGPAVRCA
jgi:hypothetical protein